MITTVKWSIFGKKALILCSKCVESNVTKVGLGFLSYFSEYCNIFVELMKYFGRLVNAGYTKF